LVNFGGTNFVGRHNLNAMQEKDDLTKGLKKKIRQMLLNGPNSDFSGELQHEHCC
jgi:hypothetical protein